MIDALTQESAVDDLLSRAGPTWLFKHSNACSVSTEALNQVQAYAEAHPGEIIGMVVVQTHRPLSTWIAKRLEYPHQSPQLFLIEDGRVRWATSHWGVTAAAMMQARHQAG